MGVCRLSSSEPLREPIHESCSEICHLLESRNPTGPTLNVLNQARNQLDLPVALGTPELIAVMGR